MQALPLYVSLHCRGVEGQSPRYWSASKIWECMAARYELDKRFARRSRASRRLRGVELLRPGREAAAG